MAWHIKRRVKQVSLKQTNTRTYQNKKQTLKTRTKNSICIKTIKHKNIRSTCFYLNGGDDL